MLDGALGVSDAGGTFSIHMFGAYFGLAVSAALEASPEPASPDGDDDDDSEKGSEKGGDGALSATEPVATPPKSRTAELFSMLGTVVLWVYWPSLVACFLDDGSNQMSRAITNTVLALTSSTVVAVALSLELSTEAYAKLRPADVQARRRRSSSSFVVVRRRRSSSPHHALSLPSCSFRARASIYLAAAFGSSDRRRVLKKVTKNDPN